MNIYAHLLTKREVQIMECLAEGHTPTECGVKLFRSVKTIATHRTNIRNKILGHLGLTGPDNFQFILVTWVRGERL